MFKSSCAVMNPFASFPDGLSAAIHHVFNHAACFFSFKRFRGYQTADQTHPANMRFNSTRSCYLQNSRCYLQVVVVTPSSAILALRTISYLEARHPNAIGTTRIHSASYAFLARQWWLDGQHSAHVLERSISNENNNASTKCNKSKKTIINYNSNK